MAEEEEAAEETEISDEDLLKTLQAKSKTLMLLLLGSTVTSLLLLGAVFFVYNTVSGKIVQSSAEPLAEMRELKNLVVEDFTNMNLSVEYYNYQLGQLTDRLNAIDPSIDKDQFVVLEQVMLSQEKDFQLFLGTVKDAVFSLSEMVAGSRAWREDFNTKLDTAISLSETREERYSGEARAGISLGNDIEDNGESLEESFQNSATTEVSQN